MTSWKSIPSILFLLSAAGATALAENTAKTALDMIVDRHGEPFTRNIVKISATGGIPAPQEWTVTTHNPNSPTLLHQFVINDRRAADEGASNDFYPRVRPTGFIKRQDIQLDSIDAFQILNREAQAAKVGFDSVNYMLRCREFSTEPVWTLSAVDAQSRIAGVIDVSAQTGAVLRKTWYYEVQGSRLRERIVDSATPGQAPIIPTTPATSATTPLPRDPTSPQPPTRADIEGPAIIVQPEPQPITPNPSGGSVQSEVPDVVPVE
ncbi:MAG: hypothetical protein AAGA58_06135 [Verrucomicrobiota bacterium]